VLERTVGALPETKAQSTGSDIFAKGLGSLLFSKNHLAYKLHLPGEIITANSQHLDGKERTIEWNYTLAQAMREPPVMRAEWKKPFPLMPVAATLILAGVAVAVFARRRDRGAAIP